MIEITPQIAIGQIIAIAVTLGGGGVGVWAAYLKFRTKIEVSLKTVSDQIVDTNRRVSDLAAGVSVAKTDITDFRSHVERHYVEKDELGELRLSVDRSIDRMQTSLDFAVATMGDVRDSVIILTAKNGKPTVPPARRRSASTRSE